MKNDNPLRSLFCEIIEGRCLDGTWSLESSWADVKALISNDIAFRAIQQAILATPDFQKELKKNYKRLILQMKDIYSSDKKCIRSVLEQMCFVIEYYTSFESVNQALQARHDITAITNSSDLENHHLFAIINRRPYFLTRIFKEILAIRKVQFEELEARKRLEKQHRFKELLERRFQNKHVAVFSWKDVAEVLQDEDVYWDIDDSTRRELFFEYQKEKTAKNSHQSANIQIKDEGIYICPNSSNVTEAELEPSSEASSSTCNADVKKLNHIDSFWPGEKIIMHTDVEETVFSGPISTSDDCFSNGYGHMLEEGKFDFVTHMSSDELPTVIHGIENMEAEAGEVNGPSISLSTGIERAGQDVCYVGDGHVVDCTILEYHPVIADCDTTSSALVDQTNISQKSELQCLGLDQTVFSSSSLQTHDSSLNTEINQQSHNAEQSGSLPNITVMNEFQSQSSCHSQNMSVSNRSTSSTGSSRDTEWDLKFDSLLSWAAGNGYRSVPYNTVYEMSTDGKPFWLGKWFRNLQANFFDGKLVNHRYMRVKRALENSLISWLDSSDQGLAHSSNNISNFRPAKDKLTSFSIQLGSETNILKTKIYQTLTVRGIGWDMCKSSGKLLKTRFNKRLLKIRSDLDVHIDKWLPPPAVVTLTATPTPDHILMMSGESDLVGTSQASFTTPVSDEKRPASGNSNNPLAIMMLQPKCNALKANTSDGWYDSRGHKRRRERSASSPSSQKVSAEDDVCAVCLDGRSPHSNQIIYCDRCDVPVHVGCYIDEDKLPQTELWFCDTCEANKDPSTLACVFCPRRGGAYKKTSEPGVWAHVQCANWITDVGYKRRLKCYDLDVMDQKRFKLVCEPCGRVGQGACIQCAYKLCRVAGHVPCVLDPNSGFTHTIIGNKAGAADWLVFCPKHAKHMPPDSP